MNYDNDYLQERAARPPTEQDAKLSSEAQEELRSYRELFSLLAVEPEFRLPSDFAARVAASAKVANPPVSDWVPVGMLISSGVLCIIGFETLGAPVGDAITYASAVLPIQTLGMAVASLVAVWVLDRLLIRTGMASRTA